MTVPGNIDALLLGGQRGYQIERSLRFNSADSAYLERTPASAGNRKTWTWSGWVKRSGLGTTQRLFNAYSGDENNTTEVGFNSSNQIEFSNVISGTQGNGFFGTTSAVFRDTSAWYHIVYAIDTTQSTAAAALKVYVNGVQQTLGGSSYGGGANHNTFVNNTNVHRIGQTAPPNSGYFNGYLTEIHFIDGQALTPSSFGETDTITGVWKPKRYSGTYGTNGFYLKFADNSGTTSTTLGKDSSGNGNNWTPNNFSVTAGAGNDSMIDTPTPYADGGNGRGNYCTLNPLDNGGNTVSNGNLVVNTATGFDLIRSTMFLSSGKWYWEITCDDCGEGFVGISSAAESLTTRGAETTNSAVVRTTNGDIRTNAVNSAYGSAVADGDVMIFALDMDSGKFWAGKNGTWFNSGNPAAGTNAGKTGLTVAVSPSISVYDNEDYTANFGQRAFAYTPPSGFLALNTQNLPEPTIKKPGVYFNTVLYTGTGTTNAITGVGFQPDFVWGKRRSGGTGNNWIFDAVRGAGNQIVTNNTNAEVPGSTEFASFDSGGFTVTSTAGSFNVSGSTYVAWCWDESATPGFDIVTYTGNGGTQNISHTLGVVPSMIIIKDRSAATNWYVYHTSLGTSQALSLNTTSAAFAPSPAGVSAVSSSNFTLGGARGETNTNAENYVAYLWSEVAGFSKFGSYTGNGSTDGPFVFCGFRPRFILIKQTNAANEWVLIDTTRNTYNAANANLYPNRSNAEDNSITQVDVLSNGFKLREGNAGWQNISGGTYIFAAFAESPQKYSLAR